VVVSMLCNAAVGAPRQVLRGHVPEAAARLPTMGRLAGSDQLDLAIGLPLRNPAELNEFLRQISDPANPDYRHYLTTAQFTERFGPTERDYEGLIEFARAHHLSVTKRHSNRMLLDVRGTVADIEQTFGVTLRTYRHPTEARTFFAPDTEPSVEADFPVLTVSGLDNYVVPHPMGLRRHPLSSTKPALTGTGSGPDGLYMGNDFRAAYVPGTTLTGAGQTVALVEFNSGFATNDILTYESLAGLPNIPVQAVLLNGYGGGLGNGNDEVSLDIEMAISMAPGLSQVLVYEGSQTDTIMSQIVTDNRAKTIGTSWTYPIDATTEQLYQEMAGQGQSFFNAAGDSDAYSSGAAVPTPAGDTNITIVGGTMLTTAGPTNAWVSETVWQEGNQGSSRHPDDVGTGGGVSSYPIPPWQQGINMATNSGSASFRNLPDVALTATNIFLVFSNGLGASVAGTSCATPLWAAFTALANQQAASAGMAPVGFINPAVYAIGKGSNYTNCFHDITTGNNTNRSIPNLYYACAGYDLCTGWGTPNGTNLINILAPPLAAMFAGNPTNGVVPLTVAFTNLSAGATNYSWTFGDGHTSTAVNPSNTYTNAGTYSVTLAAITSTGTNVLTLTNYIVVTVPPPVAGFSAGPTNGVAPLLVSFTNASSGATNYVWAFGDGHTSTIVNPSDSYTSAGIYSVTLTAIGAGGTNVLTRTNYIAVAAPPPVAMFSAGPTNGFAPLLVAFTNQSSGATRYAWTFGDGDTSTNVNPSETYTTVGVYSVTLTAIGAGGTNSLTLANHIVVAVAPPPNLLLGGAVYLASGVFQFIATNGDGTPITAAEQSRIQIYASTNIAGAMTEWVPMAGNLMLTNGYLQIDDPGSSVWPQRFYRAVLTP
jgi:PKD repeat protein